MSEDPVLIDVYSAWAEQLLQENSFEQAAQWYVTQTCSDFGRLLHAVQAKRLYYALICLYCV